MDVGSQNTRANKISDTANALDKLERDLRAFACKAEVQDYPKSEGNLEGTNGGRTRDRTLDLSRVKGTLSR